MTIDLCPTPSPHGPHRRDLGPFGVRDCPGVTDAALSPDQIGDAPATIGHYRATIANLSDDTVREALAAMYVVRDRQAEQLRRNGTLLCRVQDAIADIDRAWADHDTLGRDQPATTGRECTALCRDVEADRDALTDALEKADSARIDRDGDLWRPTTDGHWTCPGLDRLTLDELEDGWGPTRAVLLVDIAADDTDMGDPPADWRLDLGDQADRRAP